MLLLGEFLKLDVSPAFWEMFLVVIQLGAVMSVAALYFKRLVPITVSPRLALRRDVLSLWGKIIVACAPAAVIGVLFDDKLDAMFYNYPTVAVALIAYGVLFIVIERKRRGEPRVTAVSGITYKTALLVGVFQLLSLIPGTSRSGATILGAILIGFSRKTATEFTFFLALPVMLGASLLKLVKLGFAMTGAEGAILLAGCLTAFIVSVAAIRFLTGYVKKHDFTAFGWYRIALGIAVLAYFAAARL
jgi:undecaprenyl-diphosphatase